uniref:Uncharacterized protein n=1 Tax=Arcella intermedia TaxID=1963864 RepID=A0A6B2LN69_9EUKA
MATSRKKAFKRKKQRILDDVLGKLTTEEKIEGGLITDQEVIHNYQLEKLKREKEEKLKELEPYYRINQKFVPISHGRYGDKSPLEEALEQAIKEGKIELADKISNRITIQDQFQKLDAAIERKQLEDEGETQTKKKSPSLHWGFESKHRWESKGNM